MPTREIIGSLRSSCTRAVALAAARKLGAYYESHAQRPSFVRPEPPAGAPRRAN